MSYADKIGEADVLFDKIAKTLETGTLEEKAHIADMMKDARRLQEEALTLKSVEEAREELRNATAEGLGGGTGKGANTNPRAFKNVGQFFQAVFAAHRGADQRLNKFMDNDEKAADLQLKDMSGQTGSSGGFLIPVEYQESMMGVVAENSIMRPYATVIPMRRRQIQIPVLDQTGTTAGQAHWYGGLRVYWAEEASQKTSSDASFRQAVLTAWKMIMFTRASDELLDDSAISLAAFLTGNMGFTGAINWYEDFAFIQGSGVGQPLGYVNSGAYLSANRASTGHISYTDLVGIVKRFLPNSKGRWHISQSAMAELLEMSGPSGNASYIWGSAVNGAPSSLLGYPVQWTEKCPALGSKGDITLLDPSYYLIGDRQATTVESTKFERWEYDETSWRAVHRVDGRPWLSTYLTYQDGSTTVSPFSGLNGN